MIKWFIAFVIAGYGAGSVSPDTTPPADPTSLSGTPTQTTVALTWSHSNSADVDEYVVEFRTGAAAFAEFSRPTTESVTVTGLANSTAYDFRVSAEDVANNASGYATASATTLAAGSFVLVADSDLSAATQAQMPYIYEASEVDTTTGGGGAGGAWEVLDVTNQSTGADSIDTVLGLAACSPMVCNGTTDDSTNFFCMLNHSNADHVILELPPESDNGPCQIDTPNDSFIFFRPSGPKSYRAIKSSTPGDPWHIRSGAIEPIIPLSEAGKLALFWGEDEVLSVSDLGWTAGFDRGDTSITLGTGGDDNLAIGEWLYLRADPAQGQPGNGGSDDQVKFRVKVSGLPGADVVTIDRPLPDDFSGGSQTAFEWTPAVGWSLEDGKLSQEFPNHQAKLSTIFNARNMVESSFKNVEFVGYQQGIIIEDSARLRYDRVIARVNFDKNFDNNGVLLAGSSGITFIDSTFIGPEAFACAGNSQSVLIAFSYFADPEDNQSINANTGQPEYDRSCADAQCDVDFASHDSSRGGAHTSTAACADVNSLPSPGAGVVQTTTGTGADGFCDQNSGETALFLHCKSTLSDEPDSIGFGGTSACHGARADIPAGSLLLHNASCSNLAFVRNQFDSSWWHDYSIGPGRFNMMYGSLGIAGDSTAAEGGIDSGGDWGSKWNGGGANLDYANNVLIINSSVNNLGSGAAGAGDVMMDGARFEYNNIRTDCEFSSNDSGIEAATSTTNGGCGTTPSAPGWEYGTVTGSDSATAMTDSTGVPLRNLVTGGGARIWNKTDGSYCTVTAQTSTSITCSGGLANGGDNTFQAGDEWAVAGHNISWIENSVGLGTTGKTITDSMPSAPGFTADPGITGGTGTFPYVGADQGGVASGGSQNCLPAFERYHGACTQ